MKCSAYLTVLSLWKVLMMKFTASIWTLSLTGRSMFWFRYVWI